MVTTVCQCKWEVEGIALSDCIDLDFRDDVVGTLYAVYSFSKVCADCYGYYMFRIPVSAAVSR